MVKYIRAVSYIRTLHFQGKLLIDSVPFFLLQIICMQLVIGLIGEKGSGKQTFVNFFKEIASDLTIRQVRFSDILAQTLLIWDIPNTRANLQKLAIIMNDGFSTKALAHAAQFNIQSDSAQVIILDGVRRDSELKIVKKQKGSLLIYITADVKVRFERLKKRSEKVGEIGLSLKQFMDEEKVQTELEIPKLGARADLKMDNNGTLAEFKMKIQEFYNQIKVY